MNNTNSKQPPHINFAKWQVALYIRLSREDGDKSESNSIKSQREILTDYVDRNEDMEILDYYIDDGWSGTNFNRPGFNRMIEDIECKKVNCVIVKDLSRFGRNYVDAGNYIENIFKIQNVRFIALNNNIDTESENINDATQSMSLGMFNLVNENYAASTSVNIKSTLNINRKHGKFIGSFPPYGYFKDSEDRHKLIIDETAAETVRIIFNKYLNGTSILGITRYLNSLSIPNPSTYKKQLGWNYQHTSSANNDGLWCDQTVRRILSNQVYIGNMVQGKNKSISYKIKQCRAVPKDKWIIVEGTHEPIVSKEQFDRVQEMLKKRTKTSQKSGELDLFAGLLKCADCSRAMSKKTNKHSYGTYVYYRCVTSRKMDKNACTAHSIRKDELEKAVLVSIQTMISVALDIDSALKKIEKASERPKDSSNNKLLKKQKNELNQLKKGLDDIYSDWKSGILTKEEFLEIKSARSEKISVLEGSINLLTNREKKPDTAQNDFLMQFKKYKNINKLTRPILTELIDSILIHEGGNITINFKFSDAYTEAVERLYKNEKQAEIA